ncbi:MAG: ArnT family glycosyltransferase [Phycisphaerales bacterium JB039]
MTARPRLTAEQILHRADGQRPWRLWPRLLLIVGLITAGRLIYLAYFSPYALVEDEAHYWEWGRRLGLSYYSKGPGVAYLIALSTRLFGDTEFGVRAPAAIACAIAAIAVGALAAAALRSSRAGVYAAVCLLAAPFFLGAGVLMTIDIPYIAAWAVACWAGWVAIERRSASAWLLLGAAIGIGFLFKFTILLLVPGLLLFALVQRRPLRPIGAVIAACALALALMMPVALWNIQHDWPTMRHLLGHLGVAGGDQAPGRPNPYSPLWTLQYIGLQFALIGPALGLAIEGLYPWRDPARPEALIGRRYLLWCAAPILLFYFAVTFFTDGEANWAVAGHVTLLALAGFMAAAGVQGARRRRRGEKTCGPKVYWWRGLWHATVVIGIIAGIGLARPDWFARIPGLTGVIPMGRITEGRTVAAGVAPLLAQLERETGRQPLIIATHYGLASQLAFYLEGHPTVYCASALLPGAGRQTQYDYWADTDLTDLERLGGRPALLIGSDKADWDVAFERISEPMKIPDDPESDRRVRFGYGYLGFPGHRGGGEP